MCRSVTALCKAEHLKDKDGSGLCTFVSVTMQPDKVYADLFSNDFET